MTVAAVTCVATLVAWPGQAAGARTPSTSVTKPAATFAPGELLVRFRPGVGAAQRAAVRAEGDARLRRTLPVPGLEWVRLAPGDSVRAAAAKFERDPDVLYAEPNFYYTLDAVPNDPLYPQLWGLNNTGQTVAGSPGTADADIDAPEAWDTTTGSNSVVVAVVDSGIAYNDPDLAPNIWTNPGEVPGNLIDDDHNGYTDDVRGYDFFDQDNSPLDVNGHGTHVAGTIAARGNNSQGVAGVNWNASLMPLRACGSGGKCDSVAIVQAFNYAVRNGARVVNASLGSPQFSQALQDVIAGAPNTLFVAAAGNDGLNLSAPGVDDYPCENPGDNVICVGATDQNDALADFSNYGADAVDLAAPGVLILSTLAEPDTVFSEDFESNIGSTWTTGGTNNTWARTSARAARGSWSLTDSPAGNYANNTNSFARPTNPISLTGRTDCELDYQLLLAFQANDGVVVEMSPNGNDWGALDGWTGSTGGTFFPFAKSLNPFSGLATFYLRFRTTSDATVTDDGGYLDDVRVICPAVTFDAADFAFLDGTSMATPQVTGTLALMMADTPGVSIAELRQRLLANVDAKPSLAGKTVSGGRVNAAKAVESAPPPVAVTQAATAVTQTAATLNGTVNPRGQATSYRFEYGTTTSYGASTPVVAAGAGDAVAAVKADLTGLAPNTTYHYRLVATYSGGSASGGDGQFTTLASAPTVAPQPATLVTTSTAFLHGTVNPNGGATTYRFEWGPTTDYGNSTPTADAGAGTLPVAVGAPLNLLLPGTTYHFRVVATNSGGTGVSADATFTTSPLGPPVVALTPPTLVLRTSATLHGQVDPAGKSTLYLFQYGTTTNYGTSTPAGDAGAGTGPVAVSAALTSLTPGTTYHFRLIATNADDTSISPDGTFTTPTVGPPLVALADPTQVTKRSATLNGVVDPRGLDTTYHFEYGTTTGYGTSTQEAAAAPGSGPLAVSAPLSGLAPGTTYHYRIVATSADGTTRGDDGVFSTAPPTPPAVTSEPATQVAKRSATLHGTVNPNGVNTTYYFEYGTSTGYGTSTAATGVGTGTDPVPASADLTGLTPGTVYHFRLVAESADGITRGNDTQFTTEPLTPPAVTLAAATSLTPTGAKVNGTVNPHGLATTYHFEYGTTTGFGSSTPVASAGNGSVPLAVSASLGTLAPATTYHVRLVATNPDGTQTTAGTFTTPPRPKPPQVSTGAAAGIARTAATVAGTVNPNGQATTYAFQYGRTTAYGGRTATRSAGAGRAAVAVAASLSGLQPGTSYHYRVVATNATGTVAGADRLFTTAAPPPPPPPPPPAPIGLSATRTLRLDRRGAVTIRVVCPVGTPTVTGRAELFRGRAPAAAARWRSFEPAIADLARVPKRLGAKSFTTKPGATVRVRIRLTRAGRRLVAHSASVAATVRVTVLTQVKSKRVRLKRHRG